MVRDLRAELPALADVVVVRETPVHGESAWRDVAAAPTTAPAADGAAHIHLFRVLIYSGLSPAAEVHATVYPNEPLHFTFRAKPVAPPGG